MYLETVLSFGNLEIKNLILRNEDFTITKEDISILSNSIDKYGVFSPLYVRPIRQREYEILDGRKRFIIAQIKDIERLPCIIYDYMNDIKAREYYSLLHNTSGSGSIEREIEVSELFSKLINLIESLCKEYTEFSLIIDDVKTNSNTLNTMINKVLLDLLNLRYDIQNSKYLLEEPTKSSNILNNLNSLQNIVSNMCNKISSNNSYVSDIYDKINTILEDIGSVISITNSMDIYRHGKKFNINCSNS